MCTLLKYNICMIGRDKMNENEVFDFGMRLKKLRQSKKMSQEELGKRLGVSKGTIYRYECNTQAISFETAAKLAITLGTSLDYLAGIENATMIRVPNLTEEQKKVLLDFVRLFIEKNQ